MLHWKSPWQWHGSAAFVTTGFDAGAAETLEERPELVLLFAPARPFAPFVFFVLAESVDVSSAVLAAA